MILGSPTLRVGRVALLVALHELCPGAPRHQSAQSSRHGGTRIGSEPCHPSTHFSLCIFASSHLCIFASLPFGHLAIFFLCASEPWWLHLWLESSRQVQEQPRRVLLFSGPVLKFPRPVSEFPRPVREFSRRVPEQPKRAEEFWGPVSEFSRLVLEI
jgi:hypothetical protein